MITFKGTQVTKTSEIIVLHEQQQHMEFHDAVLNTKDGKKFIIDYAVDRLIDNASGGDFSPKKLDDMAKKVRHNLRRFNRIEIPECSVSFDLVRVDLLEVPTLRNGKKFYPIPAIRLSM